MTPPPTPPPVAALSDSVAEAKDVFFQARCFPPAVDDRVFGLLVTAFALKLDAARTATRQAEERATRFGHKWVEACDQALDYERERDTLAVEVGRLRSFAERVMALRGRTVTEVTPEGRIIEDLAIEACALAATPAPAVAEAVRALVAAFVDSRLSADGRDPCWCDPTGRGEHLSHCQEKRDALAQLARCAPSLVKK